MTSLLLDTLRGNITARKPVWLMRQAGRYLPEYRAVRSHYGNFLDLCFAPEAACEVTLQPLRRYNLDAGIIFSDILVVPWVLGQQVSFVAGRGPVLSPVRHYSDLHFLKSVAGKRTLEPVYEAIAHTCARMPAGVPLIGFAGSPWTLATYMVEGGSSRSFHNTLLWAYRDAAGFDALLALLVKTVSVHIIRQIEAGCQVVQLFDSWAGSVPEPLFERCVLRPTRAIVDNLKCVFPDVPVIGFPKGIGNRYAAYRDTGVNAMGLDMMTSLSTLQNTCPGVVLQGNLDPVLLVTGADALQAATEQLLAQVRDFPHVINLGHGILPETAPDHVEWFVNRVHQG